MRKTRARAYSPSVKDAILLLGKLIKLGRKERRWTEEELAERVGISRATLKKIEKGNVNCEIGLAFEAAALTGVTLFRPARHEITMELDITVAKLALLPQSIRPSRKVVEDDF